MNRETIVLAVVLFVLCSVVALLGASGSATVVTTSPRTCDPVLPQEGLLVQRRPRRQVQLVRDGPMGAEVVFTFMKSLIQF